MHIRILSAEDVESCRQLRLKALRNHPTAYCTDYSEDAVLSRDEFAARMAPSETAVTFGAFAGERLVGIATLLRPSRLRMNFRATIAAMYVEPDVRRQGVARQLIARCIEHARSQPGVEEVCLCVTVGNDAARQAYLACGFTPVFIEPQCFNYQGQYYDLEWLRLPLG